MDAIFYIHGKNGSADEAEHYRLLFPDAYTKGIDYKGVVPWKAGEEIRAAVSDAGAAYDNIIIIANSIGAYFAMNAQIEDMISHAYFISPIVDIEGLIKKMMSFVCVTESELRKRGIIHTDFGEDLSWEYLCYVREHTCRWNVPTDILYAEKDDMTSAETIKSFAREHDASLTVMKGGEHWFHTDEQMLFLDTWIKEKHDLYRKKDL